MENFTMKDIHSGYVVELRNGHTLLVMRVNVTNFTKIFVYENAPDWYYSSCWDENTLKCKGHIEGHEPEDYDIVKVYGLISSTHNYMNANTTDLDGRKLLWQRKEPRKIKMSQIRRLLGSTEGEEIIIEVDD